MENRFEHIFTRKKDFKCLQDMYLIFIVINRWSINNLNLTVLPMNDSKIKIFKFTKQFVMCHNCITKFQAFKNSIHYT